MTQYDNVYFKHTLSIEIMRFDFHKSHLNYY